MRARIPVRLMLAAAGTVMALGDLAQAQQQLVNIAGSSLLANFIKGQASTNDYIGVSAMTPSAGTDLIGITMNWAVDYRVSGSINGFDELLRWGYPTFTTVADDRTPGTTTALNSLLITDAYYNRGQYITAGALGAAYQPLNPGGTPQRAATSGADRSISGTSGGVTIDVAYIDVPTIWGLRSGLPVNAAPSVKPNVSGYGTNMRLSVGLDGSPTGSAAGGGLGNALGDLGTRNLADFPGRNPVTDPYDNNTVFAYPLTIAPVAPVANPGTGIRRLKISEMQWLWTTGRAKTGENFVVATRDVGSGTRNAWSNYTGVDPSFNIGDNIGVQSTVATQDQLGPNFWPTNKGATSGILRTVRYHRLAVGYAGAETGVSGDSWLTAQALDIIDTFNDIYYSPAELATLFPSGPALSDYVRPTLANILNNTRTGWVINGQAHITSIGDPKAESNTFRTATLPNSGGRASGNPAMVNKSAARYMNNILRSIDDFTGTTLAASPALLVGTPAEALATNFMLVRAVDNVIDPATANPLSRVPNPNQDLGVKAWVQANNTVFTNSRYSTPNTGAFPGLSPRRFALPSGTYSDGQVSNFITQGTTGTNGVPVAYESSTTINGEPVMNRNKIAFDFNGDGVRSLADATGMLAAYRQRHGGVPWVAPSGAAGIGANAVIEILGDANGDGNFDAADIRYWADGLAVNASGNLDRKQGFIAVDNASLATGGPLNFFGTTKATGALYSAGDSRADIIGPSGRVAPGWAPVGADGVIDAHDIDYIYAQMRAVGIAVPWTSSASADWANLSQAARFDLSADINGDLKVDKHDVEEILSILGTRMGDVNLDGVVNGADHAIIMAHLGQSGLGWAGGDINGDGITDNADLALLCPADINGSGSVTIQDLFDFLGFWFAADIRADVNGSGSVTIQDLFDFLGFWFAGSGGCP